MPNDAEAAAIYAEAYNQDKEFYAFLRTLESYKKSIRENGRLVISTDSDYYKYLKQARFFTPLSGRRAVNMLLNMPPMQ